MLSANHLQLSTGRNSEVSTWKVPIEGGASVRLSSLPGYAPALSSDGKLVVFSSPTGTVPNFRVLWIVVPSAGGEPLYSVNSDARAQNLQFTRDGKSLA